MEGWGALIYRRIGSATPTAVITQHQKQVQKIQETHRRVHRRRIQSNLSRRKRMLQL
jgi:hydroxymethylpyrimidine/phosphomethylpyrimidine kinase